MCNFAISAMAAETTKVKLTDVTESTKYANEILTLVELGIINGYQDSTFKADNEITRAEFTKVIAVAMGASDKSSGSTTLTDMENHWAKPYVIAAQGNNIINGFEDNTFRPDDKVTYEQAVKMLVCALRYNKTAEGLGGWPNGYLTAGSDIGVTDDIEAIADSSAPTTRGIVAKLVYNTLEVELADIENGKATDIVFMNHYLKKGKAAGTVVGIADDLTADCTESISMYEIAILDEETGKIVRIDFTSLYEDKSDLISYLGQDVVAYYDVSGRDGINRLVIFNSNTTKKETVEVFSNDVISYSNGKLKYYNKSGKSETLDFDADVATVMYNKKVVSSGAANKLANWLDPDSNDFYYGNVSFVDNGADNSIDVIEIMDYEPIMAVRAPSSSDYKLTNKIKFDADYTPVKTPVASVVLNPDRLAYLNITNASGTKIQPTGISANSIALIAESEDATSYTVLVSTETVTGTIDYYSEVDHKIKIAGKEYYISDFCIDYFKQEGYAFDLGQKGKFYVDALGTVTYGELTASSDTSTYAYIITSLYDEGNNSGSIRVYVPLKGYMTYTLDDKLRLDGSPVTAEEAAETIRDNTIYFDNDATIYGDDEIIAESNAYQLAILELDGSTVTEITTMQNETLGSNDNMSKIVRFNDLAKIKYTSSNNFNNTFYINSDTKVIFIPQDRKETSKYKKPSFSVGTQYYVEAYNVDSSKYADVVLVYGSTASGTSVTYTTPIYIMSESPFADASGDDMVTKMSVYSDTAVLADVVINENQTAAKNYDAGDIIQYVLDGDSEAIGFQRRLAYSDVEAVLNADVDSAADGDVFFDWTDDSKFKFETAQGLNSGGLKYAGVYMYNLITVNDKSLVVTRDGFKYDEASDRFSLVDGLSLIHI